MGCFREVGGWFKKVLVVILCYLSNIKLQTARISTILQLQARDPDRKLRINLLYTTIGGLGGVNKGFKVDYEGFSGYLISSL